MIRLDLAVFFLAGVVPLVGGCDDEQNDPDWIPQPNDLALVPERRLLDAVEAAQKAVANNPKSAAAWGKLGHVYIAHDWPAEAVPCYRRATELDPTGFRWFYYLGRSFKSDPAMAVDAFARAIAIDSTYAAVHVYYAESLKHLGRLREARRHFQHAARLDPQNPYSELRLGQLALSAKRFEVARNHLQRALTLHPEQGKAHTALAQVYLALGDGELAARHAQTAREDGALKEMEDALWWEVGSSGATADWFAARGSRYLRAGRYEPAVAELKVAVSGGNDDPIVWLNYGTALITLQRYDEAAEALERALDADRGSREKITPEDMERIYVNLGAAHGNMGDAQSGERYLRKALSVNPASVAAMNNLAMIYRSQARLLEAIELLKNSLAIKHDSRAARLLAALSKEAGVSRDAGGS